MAAEVPPAAGAPASGAAVPAPPTLNLKFPLQPSWALGYATAVQQGAAPPPVAGLLSVTATPEQLDFIKQVTKTYSRMVTTAPADFARMEYWRQEYYGTILGSGVTKNAQLLAYHALNWHEGTLFAAPKLTPKGDVEKIKKTIPVYQYFLLVPGNKTPIPLSKVKLFLTTIAEGTVVGPGGEIKSAEELATAEPGAAWLAFAKRSLTENPKKIWALGMDVFNPNTNLSQPGLGFPEAAMQLVAMHMIDDLQRRICMTHPDVFMSADSNPGQVIAAHNAAVDEATAGYQATQAELDAEDEKIKEKTKRVNALLRERKFDEGDALQKEADAEEKVFKAKKAAHNSVNIDNLKIATLVKTVRDNYAAWATNFSGRFKPKKFFQYMNDRNPLECPIIVDCKQVGPMPSEVAAIVDEERKVQLQAGVPVAQVDTFWNCFPDLPTGEYRKLWNQGDPGAGGGGGGGEKKKAAKFEIKSCACFPKIPFIFPKKELIMSTKDNPKLAWSILASLYHQRKVPRVSREEATALQAAGKEVPMKPMERTRYRGATKLTDPVYPMSGGTLMSLTLSFGVPWTFGAYYGFSIEMGQGYIAEDVTEEWTLNAFSSMSLSGGGNTDGCAIFSEEKLSELPPEAAVFVRAQIEQEKNRIAAHRARATAAAATMGLPSSALATANGHVSSNTFSGALITSTSSMPASDKDEERLEEGEGGADEEEEDDDDEEEGRGGVEEEDDEEGGGGSGGDDDDDEKEMFAGEEVEKDKHPVKKGTKIRGAHVNMGDGGKVVGGKRSRVRHN